MANNDRIYTKAQLRDWLAYEKKIYSVPFLVYLLQISERAVIWKHQKVLRKTEYHINAKHKIMSCFMRFRLKRIQVNTGLIIPPNVCGRGLRVMHVGSVLINSKATIGENCVFHLNSAIVAGGTNNDAPTLGNDVIVGFGAVVLGNTYVSDGVAIGANAVVNKDVLEPNIAVAGVPAKKISNNGRFEWNKQK